MVKAVYLHTLSATDLQARIEKYNAKALELIEKIKTARDKFKDYLEKELEEVYCSLTYLNEALMLQN